eukprot:CAMPEP_0201888026 /NCGR_PEP_ID=MMETSP0902-20130614/26483_1 /ASSEMBLY_ACC=CAM_ASM_000551 /TAXON_ID=420261 /ORGANISM="Thalassiosira antarctica, Strain CCMP982" /LENGTH=54 /DNA_ID=CAMNT_0048418153 /DNA_START=138 /DNA_END=299 /DNA_ORIENTATION=-
MDATINADAGTSGSSHGGPEYASEPVRCVRVRQNTPSSVAIRLTCLRGALPPVD